MASKFIDAPRRFSEVWQMDAEWPGTYDQQWAVREAFSLVYDTDQWRVMKRLDKSANQIYLRKYLTVGFWPDEMWGPNHSAIAGIAGINFRASYNPIPLIPQIRHELAHVYDQHNLITWAGRLAFMQALNIDLEQNTWNHNVQETFADAFRDWWSSGGSLYPALTPILLPE